MYGDHAERLAIGPNPEHPGFDHDAERRRRLGNFLRQKRAGLAPTAFDLPVNRRRRVAGLRREELAVLTGISVAWYTQLESGADISVSPALLRRIADVLGLGAVERAYLFTLAIDEFAPVADLAPELRVFSGLRIAAPTFEQEVAQVLAVHRNLKIQIYSACLHGTLDEIAPCIDETRCPIGLWLHDDLPRDRRTTEYEQASRAHAEFHRQIERVVAIGSCGFAEDVERAVATRGPYVEASLTLERTFSTWAHQNRAS